jgi:hypothetical protein
MLSSISFCSVATVISSYFFMYLLAFFGGVDVIAVKGTIVAKFRNDIIINYNDII